MATTQLKRLKWYVIGAVGLIGDLLILYLSRDWTTLDTPLKWVLFVADVACILAIAASLEGLRDSRSH